VSFGLPHPLARFVVFLVKDKGAPVLVPVKLEDIRWNRGF
jgi:hypothetical protein